MCKMKVDLTNDWVQRAPARVKGRNIAVAIGERTLDHPRIAPTLGTGRQYAFLISAQGPLCQHHEGPHM